MAFDAFLQSLAVAAHQPQLAARTLDDAATTSSRRNRDKAEQALNAVLKVVALRDVSTPQ